MEQTAVEWLYNEIKHIIPNDYVRKFEQAKEMEKQQLCYFYIKGGEAEINNPYVTNIEFYNKTFKKTNK